MAKKRKNTLVHFDDAMEQWRKSEVFSKAYDQAVPGLHQRPCAFLLKDAVDADEQLTIETFQAGIADANNIVAAYDSEVDRLFVTFVHYHTSAKAAYDRVREAVDHAHGDPSKEHRKGWFGKRTGGVIFQTNKSPAKVDGFVQVQIKAIAPLRFYGAWAEADEFEVHQEKPDVWMVSPAAGSLKKLLDEAPEAEIE